MKISKIFLYDEPAVPQIQVKNLIRFLKETFSKEVEIRNNFLQFSRVSTRSKIAACKIFNTIKPFEKQNPTKDEIFSRELISKKNTGEVIMYDGFELQKTLSDLIPKGEDRIDMMHIFFTNQLIGTYDYNDYRYHARALIASNPSIISTTGIVEAPAKSREYYLEQISNFAQGVNDESIINKFRGTFLEYNDSRLTKIIEGYLLQAIFYLETGEQFCDKKECRLYNAHWQKDLLYSQIESGKLCEKHQQILRSLAN